MAPRLCMAPMRLPAWSTSFWYTNSVVLEIGGSYGNTNLGASNEMGEWEAWMKAGTGDDKTDIVVIADFWERTGGLFSRDRDISSNAFQIPWGGFDVRSGNDPGRNWRCWFPLDPEIVFRRRSSPAAALGSERGDFSILQAPRFSVPAFCWC